MVHQHFSLVQKMTVLDNIILGLKQEGLFLSRMEARKSIVELAEKYGLLVRPDYGNQRPGNYFERWKEN